MRNANERDGFNVAGEVAYRLDLADGRSGIAIWNPVDLGDVDVDGDMDGNDFLLWQRGDSPDDLSPEDLADWQANFGAGASASVRQRETAAADSSRNAVPEPFTWPNSPLG